MSAEMVDWSAVGEIVTLTLLVAGTSTLIGALVGVPAGTYVALKKFRGRGFVRTLAFTFYGFPPVLAGLLVYLLLSRSGPLGFLGWLFTPIGMIVAQSFLIVPIVMGVTISAVTVVEKRLHETALTLGAVERQWRATAVHEARVGVFTAVMVGFGRAMSEVGAVLIVGGNIAGQTRVLTTAIVLETSQAHYVEASIFGVILFVIAFAIFAVLQRLQREGTV
jgi:tungstate transport system permease protein